jgi:acetyl esterase/lipase
MSVAPMDVEALPTSRAAMVRMADLYERTGKVESTDHVVTTADGAEFAVRVHRPIGVDGPLPAVMWLHGGGLVAGTHRLDDGRFDRWCPKFGVVGIAVDYGLAPERPYPGLALLARDRGELAIEFQALVYPMLDDRTTTPSSSWDVPIWPPVSNDVGWNAYLEGRRGHDDVPVYAAPAQADDLSGLPPTFICVGALDGFLDEDVDDANRLLRAGVPVELHVYPGAPHGFDLMMVNTDIARRCRTHLDE